MPARRLDRIDFARRQRRNPTDAEARLWRRLRQRQLNDHRFRRQHPIGPYTADFACTQAKLIIELDGDQHDANRKHDHRRDQYLASQGFNVLRFPNHEVLNDIEAVLETIHQTLTELQVPPQVKRKP